MRSTGDFDLSTNSVLKEKNYKEYWYPSKTNIWLPQSIKQAVLLQCFTQVFAYELLFKKWRKIRRKKIVPKSLLLKEETLSRNESENQRFSDVSRGCRKEALDWLGLIVVTLTFKLIVPTHWGLRQKVRIFFWIRIFLPVLNNKTII